MDTAAPRTTQYSGLMSPMTFLMISMLPTQPQSKRGSPCIPGSRFACGPLASAAEIRSPGVQSAPQCVRAADVTDVRAANVDHLGRVPTRAPLTAARRAAHSLAALVVRVCSTCPARIPTAMPTIGPISCWRSRMLIMNDIRLRGLAVGGVPLPAVRAPHRAQTARNPKRSLRNAAAGARGRRLTAAHPPTGHDHVR
jgi:hypothetical protein